MIKSYYYSGNGSEQWEFEETLLDKVNLFVGSSGSGKTRFLNTIFNFATSVVKGEPFRSGTWKILFEIDGNEYYFEYRGSQDDGENKGIIVYEGLKRRKVKGESWTVIIERTPEVFTFNGQSMPKLDRSKSGVYLLKEESDVGPVYNLLAKIQRRNFHDQALKEACAIQNIPQELYDEVKKAGSADALYNKDLAVSAKMYLLEKLFPNLYKKIIDLFVQIFRSIDGCEVKLMKPPPIAIGLDGVFPLFMIKEKLVKVPIPLNELSSGMQKVLLIITDILTMPEGSIYIVDEYENSLGVNAIDFLPEFLDEQEKNIQYFITTHHPYLINNMPIKNWKVFSRKGSKVSIVQGSYLEERYGKSKQKAFIQLINDQIYNG